ncbi:TPA: hypothetical protein ACHOWG_004073 [Escherichia coli]
MFKRYSEQLSAAFDSACRQELSKSLAQAYMLSHQGAKEFGSFWRQAQAYLRWFYVDAFMEKTARSMKMHVEIASNAAKNCVHPTIRSNNWSLTAHHLDGKGPLPRQAKYRSVYSSNNYDLFNDVSVEVTDFEGGHVYLMHAGEKQSLSVLNLIIPNSSNDGIIYTEKLAILSPYQVEAEKVDDELDNKFKLLTEQHIRQNS